MIEKFFAPITTIDLPLPESSSREATFFLRKNLPTFVYNTLRLLEKNPTNLPDTRMILEGRSVAGLSIDDLIQVKQFGDGAKLLAKMVDSGSFELAPDSLMPIHTIVGKEEALEWGVFRKGPVYVGDCVYLPPDAGDIPGIIKSGCHDLREISDPVARACNTFAFFFKTQPFYDCNKRTAMLAMNGILLSEGIYPLFIPAKLDSETGLAIDALYEHGDTDPLAEVFKKSTEIYYPENLDYGPRHVVVTSSALRP